jgi:hypothetical protein
MSWRSEWCPLEPNQRLAKMPLWRHLCSVTANAAAQTVLPASPGSWKTRLNSPWRAALLANLGIESYNTAHYSLALDAWREAWELAKAATDPKTKALADRAG